MLFDSDIWLFITICDVITLFHFSSDQFWFLQIRPLTVLKETQATISYNNQWLSAKLGKTEDSMHI